MPACSRRRRLIAAVRLGRSRRWRPLRNGRASTCAGPCARACTPAAIPSRPTSRSSAPQPALRRPDRRQPFDGTGYGGPALQFAYAFAGARPRRCLLFSTELRRITRDLRDRAARADRRLRARRVWGGGTRIGANLNAFVRGFGSRLTSQTFVIIFSDGLDVGQIPELGRAMREIGRRSAAIAWINPHAGEPGYAPSVRGMQAALPYVDVFVGMDDLHALAGLARRGGSAA